MNQVVNQKTMQIMDKETCRKQGLTSFELMQRVGTTIATQFIESIHLNKTLPIGVIAGIGNNGGDALVISNTLLEAGYSVRVALIGDKKQLSKDCRLAYETIKGKTDIVNIERLEDLVQFDNFLKTSNVFIEGLFGTGLSRPVEGIFKAVILRLNRHKCRVHSIDIPSGLDADSGCVLGVAVCADVTWIIQMYKYGNLMTDAFDYHGKQIIVDVNIDAKPQENGVLIPENTLEKTLPKRRHNTHKYHYGALAIFGGSEKMMGAPNLAAKAALRCGAGLSCAVYPKDLIQRHPYTCLEVITDFYENENDLKRILIKKNALVFGPGLGRDNQQNLMVLKQLIDNPIPLVIDADGLFYFKLLKDDITINKPVVLTPHEGELVRLLGCDVKTFRSDWYNLLKAFVKKTNTIVVFKGVTTIIMDKNHVFLLPVGNPGLAKAGSGDVLTGIIGARLMQHDNPLEAIKEAVLIHGKAAYFARAKFGEDSMLSSDVIEGLVETMKYAKAVMVNNQ